MRDADLDASLAALNRPPRPQSVRSATEAPPPPPSHPPPNEMADDALHNTGHISPRMRTQHPPRGGAPAASGYTRPVEEDRTAPPPDPALRPVQRPLPPHQQANAAVEPPQPLLSFKSEDWTAMMPSLLRQLAGQADVTKQREALLKIQKMTLTTTPEAEVWATHFEHVLEAVLRALQHEDEVLREQSVATTKDLIRSIPQRFRAFTEHVLLRLLAAGRDPLHSVAVGAEEALELLLAMSDTHRCMAVLVPVVMKESPPTLQLAVRLQSKLVGKFSQLQLLSILPQVLPPLFEAFKNPNADVRKAVVFCLVDMYMILGEQLTPHLAVLSTSQLKLVTIYINRTAKARADRNVPAVA
uniref:TOG domain-containing protein n=1 Tax=Haptolina ericina TaxID=156174 RepID=A0A7S3AW56_9EUKA